MLELVYEKQFLHEILNKESSPCAPTTTELNSEIHVQFNIRNTMFDYLILATVSHATNFQSVNSVSPWLNYFVSTATYSESKQYNAQ